MPLAPPVVGQRRWPPRRRVRAEPGSPCRLAAEADVSGCSAAEWELWMGARHVPPAIGAWEAEVPLVLVDTYYEPMGRLPVPRGRPRGGGPEGSNLIWLRPGDEAELLTSLAGAGVLVVFELEA